MQKLSYVIPCYRSEKTIVKVVDEIRTAMEREKDCTYEIILVNDGSPDGVWNVMQGLVQQDKRIIAVNLTRNFGQHAALMAGYRQVSGDIVISLDDDGQTPADEAMKLVARLNEGYDVVYAKYKRNMENIFRRFGSYVNSRMAEYMIEKPKNIAIQSYYAARRFIIDEILQYQHPYPYIFGLVFRATQNVSNVEVNHRSREEGTSGYSFAKLIGLWMNGFTAFSVKPLRIATVLGCLCALLGFVTGIYFIVRKFIDPTVPMGYSSLISALMLLGGMIMLMLGLLGEYIGRIYICINNAPQAVTREVVKNGQGTGC